MTIANQNIRFLITDGNPPQANVNFFEFAGTIACDTKTSYIYEKPKPGDPGNPYRFGQYLTDTLNITIIATPEQYRGLYEAVANIQAAASSCYILWNVPGGWLQRQTLTKLPYPSAVRCFSDKVTFTLTSQPYERFDINKSINGIERSPLTMNTRWNAATKAATYWMGSFKPSLTSDTTRRPPATESPYDSNGYDTNGYDIEGYNAQGWNAQGIHRDTGTPYDTNGYDIEGYNVQGWNAQGIHRDTGTAYDTNGYDIEGYNAQGWNAYGIHRDTGTPYDTNGYDIEGYNAQGYNASGLDRNGNPPSSQGLAYASVSGGYSVAKGTCTDTNVVIPAVYNGLPVTQIALNGFQNYTAMTAVSLPSSLTNIGQAGFSGCSNLTSITLPSGLTTIGQQAFSGCSKLPLIYIPISVTTINQQAFASCSVLSIRCGAASKPGGWHSQWNSSSRPVTWGVGS